MSQHAISSERELKFKIREITGYENTDDELPESTLDSVISASKLELELETGHTAWYSDKGLGFALLYLSCIKAKERIENYTVTEWDIGNETIDVSDVADEDSVQFKNWSRNVNKGVRKSKKTANSADLFSNTSSYIGE
jgi:hypothetical protein